MQKIVTKKISLLIFIFIASFFFRFYRIYDLMPFIGDQGWFYLSARDMIIHGNVPLVGITSSHTWLHQGPLWTYLLVPALLIGNFHPVSGAFLSIGIDMIAIWLVYKTASRMFSEKVGIVAAALYGMSPLVVMNARMPYHTAPIPLFTVLFLFAMYGWLQGKKEFFPLIIFSLVMLYNFELATVILVFGFLLLFIFGMWTKKPWVDGLMTRKIIVLSILAGIPFVPILLFDVSNGFLQTAGFSVWIVYKILAALHIIDPLHISQAPPVSILIDYVLFFLRRLVFLPNHSIAVFLVIALLSILIRKIRLVLLQKKPIMPYLLLFSLFVLQILGLAINRTPSEAYLPMIYPILLLLLAVGIGEIMKNNILTYITSILLIFVISSNVYTLLTRDYLTGRFGAAPPLKTRIAASGAIIRMAGDTDYSLKGLGKGTEFRAYTMNYEYLTWWLGKPVNGKSKKLIYVTDGTDDIRITDSINN